MRYDIVGDIHGQANKLRQLLNQLGYDWDSEKQTWGHQDRTMGFVGDFIDRGPEQVETLDMVRQMVRTDQAVAVLGNHEFNAIAWATPDPEHSGLFLRKHTDSNRHQHQSFLDQVGEGSALHKEWIDWFYHLPVWIETDAFRMIHACWHPHSMAVLYQHLNTNNTLTPRLVELASRKGSPEFEAVEILCKGMEVHLPEGVLYTDQQGIERKKTRVAWWDLERNTYRSSALVNSELLEHLPEDPLPHDAIVPYDNNKPLFFGHYWFKGTPEILSDQLCCVDYSAAVGDNPLVAYSFEGEQSLLTENFVRTPHILKPKR